jgi:hypothetical protein
MKNDCRNCKNMRTIPGDCHISCAKPDLDMTGNKHGIQQGWFWYPINFDPIWATKECCNFEEKS